MTRSVKDLAIELTPCELALAATIDLDPAYFVCGHGLSHLQVFEKNGTRGDDVFRHPHFVKYLRYFLYGPDLRRR